MYDITLNVTRLVFDSNLHSTIANRQLVRHSYLPIACTGVRRSWGSSQTSTFSSIPSDLASLFPVRIVSLLGATNPSLRPLVTVLYLRFAQPVYACQEILREGFAVP